LKILHGPENVAGQATAISRSQRKLGYKSDVLIFQQSHYKYECDFNLNLAKYPNFLHPIIKLLYFPFFFVSYDTFHFHYGHTLLPKFIDLYIIRYIGRAFGKRALMEYWGSDILQFELAKRYTLISETTLRSVYPFLDDSQQQKKIELISKLVDRTLVGDYSLLPFSPGSVVVRQAIDYSEIPFVGVDMGKRTINIVHAPTKRGIKGTDIIVREVERLRKEGFPIELVLVENVPHADAMEIYKGADIVVDDVLQGPYGIFAMECMALGKPVLARIDEKLMSHYQGLPILNTPPDKLHDNILMLVRDPSMRDELGRKGRRYIEENHDGMKIAQQLIQIYKSLI